MQRRTSRNLSRAVVVAVILAVGATIWQSWTAGMPGMSGVVATQWGPLSPADRDLIVKVRLACLWEMSTGQQVQQQGTAPGRQGGRPEDLRRAHGPRPEDPRHRRQAGRTAAGQPERPAGRLDEGDLVQDRLGLRPDRRAAAARGPRDRAADPCGGADQHPQRPGPRVRRRRHAVRHPAHRLPGVHRPGGLRRAARAAVARPAVRLGVLDRPARARARPHRLPAGRHPDRGEPAGPQDGQRPARRRCRRW